MVVRTMGSSRPLVLLVVLYTVVQYTVPGFFTTTVGKAGHVNGGYFMLKFEPLAALFWDLLLIVNIIHTGSILIKCTSNKPYY